MTESSAEVSPRHGRLLRCLAELLFVLAAACAGVSAAWPVLHFHETALPTDVASYFGMFNASAMIGTGHGFVIGSEEKLPALKAFLGGESVQFSLPKMDADASAFTSRFNDPFGMSHFYLVLSLGWWWRLLGVSIHSFLLFAALLYAVAAVVLYGIFRLGCGRIISLLGVLCVLTSPLWLEMVPSVRDFAKTPFVLAFLLLAGWAVLRRFSGRGLLVWALTTGIVLGFGWGFRQDLLACFLPALVLPWVVRMRERGAWRWRAASCLLLLTVLLVVGSPVISAMRANNGAVSVHTLMQGFSERSESAMSFGDASYVQYMDWGDPSAHAAAAAYAVRQGDIPPMGGFHSTSYVTAARRYIAETMGTFPADFFRRGLASACSISGVAADACRADNVPSPGRSPWLGFWARIHEALAVHLGTFGMLYVLLALAVGFAVNFRAAALLAVLGVYVGAYPSLLFQSRHVFHLSFVPYWAILFLIAMTGRALQEKCRTGALACRSWARISGRQPGVAVPQGRQPGAAVLHNENRIGYSHPFPIEDFVAESTPCAEMGSSPLVNSPPFPIGDVAGETTQCAEMGGSPLCNKSTPWHLLARGAAGVLAFLALLAVTGWCLDHFQARAVDRLLDRYHSAQLEPVAFRETPYKDGWVLVEPLKPIPGLGVEEKAEPFEAAQALLALKLDWAPPVYPIRMVYEDGFVADFTQDVYPLVDDLTREAPLTCFLPVLELNWPASTLADKRGADKAERGRFVGIAVPESQRNRVRGLFRVANAAQFPLHLFITVPDDRSRFLAAKSGPWTKEWAVLRTQWAGTVERTVAVLCRVAQHYPYDMRVRRSLESIVEAHRAPGVWNQAWPILASLNPDRSSEAGLMLDRFSEECSASGDLRASVDLYRTAIQVAPGAQWHKLNLGKAYERLGRKGEALAQYLEVLGHEPESPALAEHVDQMYVEEKDTAGRLAAWQSLCGQYPSAFVPAHHLALAYAASGDMDRALAEHERAFKISPDHAAQLVEYGRALLGAARGREAEGLALVDRAVAADPSTAPLGAQILADTAARKAGEGDLVRAEELYRRAVVLAPNDGWHQVHLGEVLVQAGKTDEAAAAFSGLLRDRPESPYCASKYDELLAKGDSEKRLEAWKELGAVHPEAAIPRFYLGKALESLERWEEAASAYQASFEIDPKLQEAWVAGAALGITGANAAEGLKRLQSMAQLPGLSKDGMIAALDDAARRLREKGEMGAALDAYRNALTVFPDAPLLLFGQSEALEESGDRMGALDVCVRLLMAAPESPKTAKRLDTLCKSAGPGSPSCVELWKRIVQAHPDTAVPQLHLGLALEASGDGVGARTAFEKALKTNPALAEARDALGRVRN